MRSAIAELEAVGTEAAAGRAAQLRYKLDRMTGAVKRRLGVTIDVERLDDGELQELWELGEKLLGRRGWEDHGVEPFALSTLDARERVRFEELVAKAAGEPGLFERTRQDEKLRRRLVELARRPRPAERVIVKEPGAVALPAALFDLLRGAEPAFDFGDLGLLVAVVVSLENGRSVFHSGRIEGEGDQRTLVLPRHGATSYHEPDGCQVDVARSCRRLAKRQTVGAGDAERTISPLLTFVEQGGERRISAGPLLGEAWAETPA